MAVREIERGNDGHENLENNNIRNAVKYDLGVLDHFRLATITQSDRKRIERVKRKKRAT